MSAPELPAPTNGVEQYLAAILAELRAQRAVSPVVPDGTVELREPAAIAAVQRAQAKPTSLRKQRY